MHYLFVVIVTSSCWTHINAALIQLSIRRIINFVKYCGFVPSTFCLAFGILQDSNIGSLLFLLCFNSLRMYFSAEDRCLMMIWSFSCRVESLDDCCLLQNSVCLCILFFMWLCHLVGNLIYFLIITLLWYTMNGNLIRHLHTVLN